MDVHSGLEPEKAKDRGFFGNIGTGRKAAGIKACAFISVVWAEPKLPK